MFLDSPNISLAVAFATAMFSQLLTQLGVILEQHKHLQKIESTPISPAVSNPELALEDCKQSLGPSFITDDKDEEKVDQLSAEVESLRIEMRNGKDGVKSSDDAEEKIKKKKNVLALRRRRRVFKNMIPTSSSDESDTSDVEGSLADSDAKDDSDESEYGWSSDSENYSDTDEDDNDDKNEVASKHSSHIKGEIKRDRAFGSSSSSQSRSDTSGNSAVNGLPKSCGEPPSLEFPSGKNSIQSNCSNGGGDVDIDGESHHENGSTEKFVISADELRKCRSQLEPLMVGVLPFVRWLQVSPEIKDAFAANCGKDYVVAMCNMFNLLGSQNWAKRFEDVGPEIKEEWRKLEKLQEEPSKLFQWQLPEDRSMLGLPRYEAFVKDLNTSLNLSENELVRITSCFYVVLIHDACSKIWQGLCSSIFYYCSLFAVWPECCFLLIGFWKRNHFRWRTMRRRVNSSTNPQEPKGFARDNEKLRNSWILDQ